MSEYLTPLEECLAEISLQAQAEHKANPDHKWKDWYNKMRKEQRQGFADYS